MRIIFCLMVFLFIGKNTMLAQQLSSFVEYGAALHTGDNTPLLQVSNQQGLTSLDNNTYIDRKSTRLNSSHASKSRMPSSA